MIDYDQLILINQLITGRLAHNIVYYRHPTTGKIHARAKQHTNNPRTPLQQLWRSHFAAAVQGWQLLPTEAKHIWNNIAKYMPKSGYNHYISCYLKAIVWPPAN